MKVLLIDRDRQCCTRTGNYLAAFGHNVATAPTGPAGVERAHSEPWGIIILDLTLPELDGFEVLRRIRHRCDTPVLVQTSGGDEMDQITALEVGADGCLRKDSSPRHLLARLHAVTRRATVQNQDASLHEVVVAELRITPDTRSVTLHDRVVALTPSEFAILLALGRAKGRVKTRDDLLAEVSHREHTAYDRAIDVQVSSLRRKLGDDPKCPRFILTVRSAGYMLVDSKSPSELRPNATFLPPRGYCGSSARAARSQGSRCALRG